MLDVDEALTLTMAAALGREPPPGVRISLESALHRVLAEEVLSPVDVPANHYSAMDGYALHAADALVAGQKLPVVGECRTGHATTEFPQGSCVRIFTGARLPDSADTVVPQENVVREGECVRFLEGVRPAQHIRYAGEDLRHGARVLEPGCCLTPFELALLSTVERTEVTVFARPRVAVLCTGDELRPPGSTFFGGHLAESNGLALVALAEQAGAEAHRAPLVRDDREELRDAIRNAARDVDLLLTVGGVSVGDHDLVRPVLESLGAEIIFHKVKIKPGKPALFAKLGRTMVLGLPGNPASAQVIMALFGVPLVRALSGRIDPNTAVRRARLTEPFRQKPGRRGYYRAKYKGDSVEVLSNQASGAATSAAWGNCFVVIDAEASELAQGHEVVVLAYSDLR